MQFVDAVQITGFRETRDGYLAGHALAARTGIQTYAGHEVGKPLMQTARVYRPDESVFAKDSMTSFVGKPICDDHPDEIVNASNWKDYAKGQVGEEIARDGEAIRISLALMDADTIQKVRDGKRELSVGYRATLDWTPGTAPDGSPYDAIQKDIFVDHVAVVDQGRAGSRYRIGDGASDGGKDRTPWGASPIHQADNQTKGAVMSDALRTVMVDGLQVKTTDEGAAAIEKLTAKIADGDKALTDAKAKHDKAMAAKDADLAKRDAQIDELKGKVLSDADIDKRVADRASLIDAARKIAKDIKTDGLTDADIRKAAVTSVKGEDAIKDKSDAYVDALFDVLVENGAGHKQDAVAEAFKTADATVPADAAAARDKAMADRNTNLTNAWKGDA